MKMIAVEQSVGMLIAHDMTEIIPGKSKGPAFKKGHIIKEEDIPRLLNMGKDHIGIFDFRESDVHENEAAIRMAKAASGQGIRFSEPSEGKVSLIAKHSGLLKVNYKALNKINSLADFMMASLHTDIMVNLDMVVGGTRIIPLVIENEKLISMENICMNNGPVIQVVPLRKLKAGIITTGNEVFYRRIPDKFGPVVREKFKELGSEAIWQTFSRDDPDRIAKSIKAMLEKGVDIITVTGGMSVDPDDVTPGGIKKSGAEIVSYGAPTLPGAMFLLAYIGDIPVLGLPGCVMYSRRTIFDLVVPKLAAGERVTKDDISKLGHGGLCLNCSDCRYPNCGFGKGGLY
ncbi:MAG: molybdopterin-binding protein [Thermotaleaceae bacterium]